MNLKKMAFAFLASSMLLAGCSSSVSQNKNGEDILASLNKKEITADSFYEDLLASSNGEYVVFDTILNKLIDKVCPVTDAMETTADTQIETIQTYYKNYYSENADAQLETDLASSGYDSIEAYRDGEIIRQLQRAEFLLAYVEKNFDEVFEDYIKQESPRMLSMIFVQCSDVENPTEDEKVKLEEVKALLHSDKSFAEIAEDYSDDTNTNAKGGKLGVVDSTSDLATNYGSDVETAALALQEGAVSDAIKGTNGYYFFQCTSSKKEDIKKQIKDMDINTPLIAYDQYMIYLAFNSYKLTFEDSKIEEAVSNIVEDALQKRNEQRGGSAS